MATTPKHPLEDPLDRLDAADLLDRLVPWLEEEAGERAVTIRARPRGGWRVVCSEGSTKLVDVSSERVSDALAAALGKLGLIVADGEER